jgi:hypothetical protein
VTVPPLKLKLAVLRLTAPVTLTVPPSG